MSNLNKIAQDAESELNSYPSKMGTTEADERKFPGSQAKVGDDDDLVTNASYNRRIPGDEGGDRDDRGHWLRGSAYEGVGGPEDKIARIYQHNPGKVDESVVKGWGKNPTELQKETINPGRPDLLPPEEATAGRAREPLHQNEVSEQGRLAAKLNAGLAAVSREEIPPRGRGESRYKGAEYETPEMVPDQTADQNEIMPESAVERSKNI